MLIVELLQLPVKPLLCNYGIDPASCVFDKDLMRWHLFQCLEAERLTGYPAMDTN